MRAVWDRLSRWQMATFVLIAVGLFCNRTFAAELPEELAAALQQNVADLDPCGVSWTEQYEPPPEIDRRAAIDGLGVEEPTETYFAPRVYRICWNAGRIYQSSINPVIDADGHLATDASETAFDGAIFYLGKPNPGGVKRKRVRQPRLLKDSVDTLIKMNGAYAQYMVTDYFENAGFRLPCRAHEFRAPTFRSVIAALMLEKGDLTSVARETLRGKIVACVRITAENPEWREAQETDIEARDKLLRKSGNSKQQNADELDWIRKRRELPPQRLFAFYLDPTLRYAVSRREERYPDGRLISTCDCSDFHQVPGRGVWLPRRCVVQNYSSASAVGKVSATPLMLQTFVLNSCSAKEISQTQFVLNYTKAGTMVSDTTGIDDSTKDVATTYIVPARPEDLDRAIEDAKWRATTQSGWSRSSLVFIILSVVFVVAAVWLFIARRRQLAR